MARLGEIIDGKYEVLREIGRGGMSVVYLAMDKRLNKQWAIKEFRKDKDDASRQVALKALLDEANLMKKLDHPTLPRIVDIIDIRQTVYVIMDYIEGESLNKVLDAYGAQPQEAVIEWAKQLSDVLDYLHTQSPPVIYRDMKPANIMLKPDGTVRLIDFGIAREYKEGKAGDTEAIGTRGYAAPEQFGGKGQTDARTDIYSLGVTLYHLVTGKNPAEPPYELYPIRHWNPSLSSGFEWLIQKCTQLNPNDRYQSCAEVSYVLEHLKEFDVEYIKKTKSRFNLFLTSTILTVVFAIACAGCFLGGASAKKNSYNGLIADGKYISAIEVNRTDPQAYTMLADQLYDTTNVITSGSSSGTKTPGSTITRGDLLDWFPDETMLSFKEKYPADYARIQFTIGKLLWEKYKGSPRDSMNAALPYFESVISVVQDGRVEDFGLTKKEYNFTRVNYLVSFFQINQEKLLAEDAAGNKMGLPDAAIFAGIDTATFERSVYLSFWNTNTQLLDLLNSDDEADLMTPQVKLTALGRLSYILEENYRNFCGIKDGDAKISKSEFDSMLKKFDDAMDKIPDESAGKSYSETKKELQEKINTLIPIVDAFYSGIKNTQQEESGNV